MVETDYEFIRSLKELRKERTAPNYHKILTLLVFFGVLISGGFFMLRSNPEVTGLVTQTMEKSNSCSIDGKNYPVFSSGNSFSCELIDSTGNKITLSIKNVFVPERSIVVKNIKINSCEYNFEKRLNSGKTDIFEIPCVNHGVNNDMEITYLDLRSQITHTNKGSLVIVKK